MESILLQLTTQIAVPVASVLILTATGYGLKLLRSKIKLEEGKIALDQVDKVVSTVVGRLSQTVAKEMRAASADGHLSVEEAKALKRKAFITVTQSPLARE